MSLRVDELFSGEEVHMPNLRFVWFLVCISFPLSFLGLIVFTSPLGLICAFCSWKLSRDALQVSTSGFYPNIPTSSVRFLFFMSSLALLSSVCFMLILVPSSEDVDRFIQFFSVFYM